MLCNCMDIIFCLLNRKQSGNGKRRRQNFGRGLNCVVLFLVIEEMLIIYQEEHESTEAEAIGHCEINGSCINDRNKNTSNKEEQKENCSDDTDSKGCEKNDNHTSESKESDSYTSESKESDILENGYGEDQESKPSDEENLNNNDNCEDFSYKTSSKEMNVLAFFNQLFNTQLKISHLSEN